MLPGHAKTDTTEASGALLVAAMDQKMKEPLNHNSAKPLEYIRLPVS